VLEPLGAPSNELRERIRVLQASKRELKGHLHGGTSSGCACRFRARMCGKLDKYEPCQMHGSSWRSAPSGTPHSARAPWKKTLHEARTLPSGDVG
jgi:hypothetical protein